MSDGHGSAARSYVLPGTLASWSRCAASSHLWGWLLLLRRRGLRCWRLRRRQRRLHLRLDRLHWLYGLRGLSHLHGQRWGRSRRDTPLRKRLRGRRWHRELRLDWRWLLNGGGGAGGGGGQPHLRLRRLGQLWGWRGLQRRGDGRQLNLLDAGHRLVTGRDSHLPARGGGVSEWWKGWVGWGERAKGRADKGA